MAADAVLHYVVAVRFDLHPARAAAFLAAVAANARTSREREPGCRQFDVCVAADDPARIFLYEVYDDRAAFEAHLASPHFRAFDAATAGWVVAKDVATWNRTDPR